ncbi:DUF6551 family protein [Nocardia asiatica]|uniref:DUF6551 family protein n=1 Tax=Nocardia asiatica TaxID=209252 RepID=UPI00030A5BC6|nr:DUF6551 family protein [Nocardia asiatica]
MPDTATIPRNPRTRARSRTDAPSKKKPTTPRPYFAAVTAKELFADPAYQRALDRDRVKRLAEEWDRTRVDVIEVSHRPGCPYGRFAVIDGMHRWAAAGTVDGDMPLVVRVHTGLSLAEEARMCRAIDHHQRRRIVLTDEASADIDQFRRRITDALDAARTRPSTPSIHRLVAADLIDDAVSVSAPVWRHRLDHVHRLHVMAVGLILHHYRDRVEREQLVDALTVLAPREITAAVKAAHHEGIRGGDVLVAAGVIVAAYNRQRGLKLPRAELTTYLPAVAAR